ncbi:hypothetical protein ABPG74_018810 [Tetrahymena malaccensis]
MGTIFEACQACSSNSNQSKNVVFCIWISIQLLFYFIMTGLCVREFWIKKVKKQRFWTKKSFVLYAIFALSIIQIIYLAIYNFSFMKTFDVYSRQILFCSIFFYFIHKYYKMTDSKKITERKLLLIVFLVIVLTLVGLMLFSYFSQDGMTFNQCEDLTGLWIRIAGTVIGFLFVSMGFLFYKKFSIHKKNFISLFTIEQEQGIKNFLDQEDKLEDLLSLIVVYFSTQFLLLCVLIYYMLQLENSPNENSCTILPPSYLKQADDGREAGEQSLKSFIQIIVTFLPLIYLFNLFKYKRPRTEYSNEMKKSLISNEDLQNGFGRNIQFNNLMKSRKNKYKDSSNNDISASLSFISNNDI